MIPQLQKAFINKSVSFHSSPGAKLGKIVCAASKTKHNTLDQKSIYKLKCSCNLEKCYIGQTRVNIKTRIKQHEEDITSNKDSNTISGISKHARECSQRKVDWDKPVILKTIIEKIKHLFK